MTQKQYNFTLRSLGSIKDGLNGKRVRITYANRKSRYYETLNAIGTIKNTSSVKEFGILLDDFTNPASNKGLFWYRINEFEFLENKSEDNNMGKLTGYEKVAVIKQGYSDYYFALYDEWTRYIPGSKVVVSGDNELKTISEIITLEEASQRFKGNITSEVITLVDTSAYDKRVAKRKAAEELKKSMDKAIREMQEVDKYEMYAKQNPALKDMLDQYKKLVG